MRLTTACGDSQPTKRCATVPVRHGSGAGLDGAAAGFGAGFGVSPGMRGWAVQPGRRGAPVRPVLTTCSVPSPRPLDRCAR